MRKLTFAIALTIAIPILSTSQDAIETPGPEAEPESSGIASSLPKFSLPFNIPGLSKEEESPEVAPEDTAPHALPDTTPGSAPSPEGVALGKGPMPPGVGGNKEGGLDFVQRSNFVISKVRNNFRKMDPFGLPMDPTNPADSPALTMQYEEEDDIPVLTNSSLKSALATLPISGIYPKKSVIVIGARSFSRGDQFGMKLEELTIRLRFEGLRGHKIYFKDLDTQEVASVDFNPTPKEFEPITSNTSPPQGNGIVPMDSLFIVN
ncbi:MAG: hypothetical protein P1U85_18555 [Verrucomicrobiales bacterium]|nr:hypothetical protein [Verrucomicrobiales bacterium]